MAALKLGTLIDKLYKAEQLIGEAQREVSKLEVVVQKRKAARKKLANEIRDRFKKGTLEGAEGRVARVSLKTVVAPTLKDWGKLAKFVVKNDCPEIFQRRISKTAWLDLLEDRKQRPVPGIETYEEVRLSVTKKR